MPIASNNNGVNIPFTADSDDLVAESKRVISELDKVKDAVKQKGQILEQQAQREHAALEKSKMSWTEFRSMYSTVLDVVKVGQAVWDATTGKYVDNAVEAGNLARALGTTVEEASRLKEVSDDVGIGIDTLRTAFKAAQKDGFSPTIDGIARMSDEYLKLAPGVERTQFLLDRFGKSGEDMGKLLEKGSASIRQMSAAIDENLIFNEQAYLEARKFQIAQDDLKDSWDGFMMSLGKQALPKAIGLLGEMNSNIEESGTALGILRFGWDDVFRGIFKSKDSIDELAEASTAAADTADEAAAAFESEEEKVKRLADEAKAAADAIKEMSQANTEYLSLVGKLSDDNEKYAQSVQKIQQDLDAGNITIDEANQKWQELADAQEEASQRMVLNMLQQELAVDGLDAKESDYLLQKGMEWGIYSESAVSAIQQARAEVDRYKADFNSIPTQKTVTITTIQQAVNAAYTNSSGQAMNFSGRASGGPVMAGTPYMVGEKGPELFTPTQSGSIASNKDTESMFSFDYNRLGDVIASALSQSLQRYG
jgi:hypothetical protein